MGKSLRVAYGEALVKLGEKNDKVVVMDADLAHATQTGMFKDKYPERFYNMGIAEANMMCAAAGFAHTGYVPFVSTFALFGAGRAFEQIRNSICYTTETEKAVMAAAEIDGPVYIRVARPVCDDITTAHTPFIPGKANVMKEGNDVCLIACGLMIPRALEAAAELEKEGSSVAVVNMHTVKPIDKDIVLKMNESCKAIVTVEEHSVIGGLGSAVAEVLAGHNGAKFAMVGIEDKFGKSGKPDQLFEAYGLTAANVAAKAKELLK